MSALVAATLEEECLTEVLKAAQLEMWYTVEQGINRRSLVAADACMTLKLLFLFSCEMKWSEQRRIEYWRIAIQLAVVSGPGLLVCQLFYGDETFAKQALTWMMQFDRTQSFSQPYIFMPPQRYDNEPRVDGGIAPGDSDEEQGGVGGDEESSHSGVAEQDGEGESKDEERSRHIVPRRSDNTLRRTCPHRSYNTRHRTRLEATPETVERVQVHLHGMKTPKEVRQALKDFDPLEPPPEPMGQVVASPSFKIDTSVLMSCINILRGGDDGAAYDKKLPTLRKFVEEGEDTDEEEGEKKKDTEKEPVQIVSGNLFFSLRVVNFFISLRPTN